MSLSKNTYDGRKCVLLVYKKIDIALIVAMPSNKPAENNLQRILDKSSPEKSFYSPLV